MPVRDSINSFFTRRNVLTSLLCLPLASCQDSEKATVRYRVIAKVRYQGKLLEASTVMECSYWRIKNSLTGMGGGTKLYGEALIFDLPDGKTFYILPHWRDRSGPLLEYYEHRLLGALGVKNSVGTLSDQDIERLKTFRGRVPMKGGPPAIVAFDDEANPKTIYEVAPFEEYPHFPGVRSFTYAFPGVEFLGLDIEITGDPVTEKLRKRLPWLNFNGQVFDRNLPGRDPNPAYADRALKYIIVKAHFFGNGSR